MKRTRHRQGLLLAFYADDFTGSTDALESLARAGLQTALFLQPPTAEQLAEFPDLRAFGISGGSRIMSPIEMEQHLPPAFEAIKASGAAIVHYKTCSTFDSSPAIGSIGKAIELGRRCFGECLTPLVVGFPTFGRHVLFGNLFARSGNSEVLRLDRHPMSRHPITPMDEADLRVHLGKQTSLPIELLDILRLRGWSTADLLEASREGDKARHRSARRFRALQQFLDAAAARSPAPVMLFDTLDEEDLPIVGRLVSGQVHLGRQLFCAGSSGVGYALVAHWRRAGLLPMLQNGEEAPLASPVLTPAQTIVASGSCSPNTDRQIGRALEAGYCEIACDVGKLAHTESAPGEVERVIGQADSVLHAGRHVIFHTARGVTDRRRAAFEQVAEGCAGTSKSHKLATAGATLGNSLGKILLRALETTKARRAIICGGDTATQAGRAMQITALEYQSPFATGAPLCRIHARGRIIDGCELICKGGQMGSDSFFLDLIR